MSINDQEKEILDFWEKNEIFKKTLEKESPMGDFVFYEGPPTANGRPGIHHVLARAFKDAIPRYKTMRGYRVERKAGWDTHGLPVELEVEKELGLKNKKEVEDYGLEKFNKKCKESVWKYKEEWEKMTQRIGYWLDLENPYITYDNNYIESLWWIIKQINNRGLLYKGHRVTPQCPRCGTGLSSHEVAQGYKKVKDKAVTIKFKLKPGQKLAGQEIPENTFVLAWTTTPWTLPGNVALAVGEDIDYVLVKALDRKKKERGITEYQNVIIARDIFNGLASRDIKDPLKLAFGEEYLNYFDDEKEIQAEGPIKWFKGKGLKDLKYEPLFKDVLSEKDENFENAFKIYTDWDANRFVSTEEGTGVVHTSVMYGAEDYELGEKYNLPKVHTVNLDGTFNERVEKWRGRFVKDEKLADEIIEDLENREENGKKVNLIFGIDNNYSHDYPFCWRCQSPLIYYAKDSWYFAVSKLKEKLLQENEKINWIPSHIKNGRFGEWLKDIKDWAISRERYWGTPIPIWKCQKCEKTKVIGSREELGLDNNFDLHRPYIDEIEIDCDCGGKMQRIPEVMDCWFDSGSMPFAQIHYPFENKELIDKGKKYPADYIAEAIDQTRGWFYTLLAVAVLLDKQAPYKNVICLGHILDKNGQKMSKSRGNAVDPWEMIEKYGADAVRWHLYTINQPGEPKKFDEKDLKNSAGVFVILRNVLNFYKMFAGGASILKMEEVSPENILDRWILIKLSFLIKEVSGGLDNYDLISSARKIEEFINDLSTWYIRLSRERFRESQEKEKDKIISVLNFVLLNLSKLLAPFAPFVSEYIFQEIKGDSRQASVHLEYWPIDFCSGRISEEEKNNILQKMDFTKKAVEIGLALRNQEKIKVRQPLSKLEISLKDLNILDKKLDNLNNIDNYIFVDLAKQELNIKEIVLSEESRLDVELTPELIQEGLLRELIRKINQMRKDLNFSLEDKNIEIRYKTASEKLKEIFTEFHGEIKKFCLIVKIKEDDNLNGEKKEKVEGEEVEIDLIKR